MKGFFENSLHIARDGDLHINEVIGIAIIAVVAVIILLLIADSVKKRAGRAAGRKRTIFSHRPNRYRTRIKKKKRKR